jgi:flagellar basal-body rod protein FlgG
MQESIPISSSSLEALSHKYEVITQNLANTNTAGYKRRNLSFAQELAAKLRVGESPSTSAATKISQTPNVDFTQGAAVLTGRPLDVALKGKGFFVIESPEGPVYTRNGSFRANKSGQLVDILGRTVSGDGGPITIPGTASTASIQVSQEGQISVDGAPVGKLKVVEFTDMTKLTPAGASCFQASPEAGLKTANNVVVAQGYQEASNVNVVEELVDLIMVTRLYEANLKTISTQDEKMKNLLRVAVG